MTTRQILVDGGWRASAGDHTFRVTEPATLTRGQEFPISPWDEVESAVQAGSIAFADLERRSHAEAAQMLDIYADLIDANAERLGLVAQRETGLAAHPRLVDVEIPRTTTQLRSAAAACRESSWTRPTIDSASGIASYLAPIPGPVVVFGPNNFPFAFNGASGGDFAAAIATGHPVIAKANPGHPETTRLLAELALEATVASGLPPALVQLLYGMDPSDGLRLVSDRRVAAVAFTGSRSSGLALKRAADEAGQPIYLELSSTNPVVLLPSSVDDELDELVTGLAESLTMGAGQFCTSPGLILTVGAERGRRLRDRLVEALSSAGPGLLLSQNVLDGLATTERQWIEAGAERCTAPQTEREGMYRDATLFEAPAAQFLAYPAALQAEAFGNASLLVVAGSTSELLACLEMVEPGLTASIYGCHPDEEALYGDVARILRPKVGRLLNDKAPTGVAVVAAMNHGGPYPSTGHPGFTAVGIPASLTRFGMLQCFDNVADHRLPDELKAANPLGIQRLVDGTWTR